MDLILGSAKTSRPPANDDDGQGWLSDTGEDKAGSHLGPPLGMIRKSENYAVQWQTCLLLYHLAEKYGLFPGITEQPRKVQGICDGFLVWALTFLKRDLKDWALFCEWFTTVLGLKVLKGVSASLPVHPR